MRKTVIKALAPAFALLCLLALSACPPDATPAEATEQVVVTNIPLMVNSKTTYKVYVLLSEGSNATAGHVAMGAKLTNGQATVTMPLTDPADLTGNTPWTGSNFNNVCVLISAQTVSGEVDTDARVGTALSSKTLSLDWNSLMQGKGQYINTDDYTKMYNNIIGHDPEITTP
jgi:hypothetical protein